MRLDRITTRAGDGGTTGLVRGERLLKSHPRFAAIGDVDELNAWIGLFALDADPSAAAFLRRIQQDLFDIGADLATPDLRDGDLRITKGQITKLDSGLQVAGKWAYVCRAVCRRAERSVVAVGHCNPLVVVYLNHLAHCFPTLRNIESGRFGLKPPTIQSLTERTLPVIDAFLAREAALAQLRAEREWRPIETAPKDDRILGWAIGWDDPMILRWTRYNGLDAWRDWDMDPQHPTRWQPLPEPPAAG